MNGTINIDNKEISFTEGQTIIEAATAADIYIPHLCHHPQLTPHGSCKLCTVSVNGRICSACTFPAADGQEILSNTDKLNEQRKMITQMLFIEGNHFCPSCEKSGNCQLQAVGYYLNMLDSHFPHYYPKRAMDASHPDLLIDHDRCIFCTLCVRASEECDGKNVFAVSGRGMDKRLIVNSKTGRLIDSDIDVEDLAADICPTGAILIKGSAYRIPIGERQYDDRTIDQVAVEKEG